MSTPYIIILVVLVLFLGIFAYLGTKDGIVRSLYSFLRFALPMALAGVIVKISHLISRVELVNFIIGGIGSVIFFVVLRSILVTDEKRGKLGIIEHFIGCVIGLAQGWLLAGFVMLYVDFFRIFKISSYIPGSLFNALVIPAKWLVFLDFIRF